MRFLLAIIITLVISSIANAQPINFEWANSSGSTGFDYASVVKTDSLGNIYTTGVFNGTVDFDPGVGTFNLTSAGSTDIFIQKLDPSGQFLWALQFGNTSSDGGTSIAIDELGNVYVTGKFRLSVDFDPSLGTAVLTASAGSSAFVLKLDPNGNYIWAKAFSGNSNDIHYDGLGNIYTTGYFLGTSDFDHNTGVDNRTSNGSGDAFVHKMDTAGVYVWTQTFGGSDLDLGSALTTNSIGEVFITGSYKATVDFDPGAGTSSSTALGDFDIFTVKLNASGTFVWSKTYGGIGSDRSLSILVDSSGNIITGGYFANTVDFDPNATTVNLTSPGIFSGFIHKLDPSGNFQYVKSFMGGANGSSFLYSLTMDAAQNIYGTGLFQDTIDFDPNAGTYLQASGTNSASFISKMDNAGNLIWATMFGDSGSESIGIDLDPNNAILCAGAAGNMSDYDPTAGVYNLTSAGNLDIFVLKLSQCEASFSNITASACDSYTSPSGKVWTSSNTYMDTIANASNCDSIISINLTINNASSSSITVSACDSYTSPSGNYVWTSSNTYMDTIANASNCDSIITINLTINNASSSSMTVSACDSYTSPSGNYVWTSSNTYTDTIANASNCDSIITINLTINTIDTSVSDNGNTLVSNEAGAVYQWIECSNMTAISGAVNASFTPVVNGDYAVVITKNGCSDTSACYFVTVVGIIQHNFDTKLLVYPNPTQGDFAVDLGAEYETVSLRLTDLTGKVIETKTYQNSQYLNVSLTQPAGVYLLTLQSEDKKTIIKLIKN